MDMKAVGKWSYLVGIVLAVFSVFVDALTAPWAIQLLLILGVLVGFFHHSADDILTLGMIYLGLNFAADSLDAFLGPVGGFITDIAGAWVGFLGPVVLITFMVWGTPKLLGLNKE